MPPRNTEEGISLPLATGKHIKKYVTEFHGDLRIIAVQLAKADKLDSVSARHVDRAFSALQHLGLTRRPLWKRPEAETAAGGALFGFAFSSLDAIAAFASDDWKTYLGPIVFTICIIAASLFLFHGWMRGRA
jgi:hypothetical protein